MHSGRAARTALDVERLRQDFPILHQQVYGHPLVYLDNAATTQKPRAVIDAVRRYYERDNSNVHRGVHALSQRATEEYEGAREKVRAFLNAGSVRELVFVRGTTEAINLVASTFGRSRIREGDEIVLTEMEHHSNIVPWQLLAEQTGAVLRVVPINEDGELVMGEFEKFLGPRTRLVTVAHLSNALGTINPVRRIIELAHAHDVPVLLDGAQAAPHIKVDVQELDCDFYAFSGHKLYGPTGIGVLYGKAKWLESMPPYQGGGEMIRQVSFKGSTYGDIPCKFEAGTPNIAGAVGLGAAIDYVRGVGLDAIAAHEQDLLDYALTAAGEVPGMRVVGRAREKASILSFVLESIHPHDIGTILDRYGLAVRAGHHCAMPVMEHYCLPATARASFALYNTRAEVDALIAGIRKVQEVFGQ
ncbi:MAG: cysteine sulfinate desulfinase [Chromatiales bacterium 21-64-14]|nr:MAG: cysteine sulfinate desulfinase [Chromatiales bacterium 21-64-14]HQU15895.1 cysteine desulfurase [Gammaproteobacteria bacterium]